MKLEQLTKLKKTIFLFSLFALILEVAFFIAGITLFILSISKEISLPLYAAIIVYAFSIISLAPTIVLFVFSIVGINSQRAITNLVKAISVIRWFICWNIFGHIVAIKTNRLLKDLKLNKPDGYIIISMKEMRKIAWARVAEMQANYNKTKVD